MPALGGPIESVTVSGRRFAVAQDAGVTRDLGGFTSTVEMNGDGTGRQVKERRPFLIEGVTVEVDDDRGDQEFLQAVADAQTFTDVAMQLATGTVYSGLGTITDTLSFDTQKSTVEIKLSGPLRLRQQ